MRLLSRKREFVFQMIIAKKLILEEVHKSELSIHYGSTKTYHDFKKDICWFRMKDEIAMYVSQCLVCQRVTIDIKNQQVCNNL